MGSWPHGETEPLPPELHAERLPDMDVRAASSDTLTGRMFESLEQPLNVSPLYLLLPHA